MWLFQRSLFHKHLYKCWTIWSRRSVNVFLVYFIIIVTACLFSLTVFNEKRWSRLDEVNDLPFSFLFLFFFFFDSFIYRTDIRTTNLSSLVRTSDHHEIKRTTTDLLSLQQLVWIQSFLLLEVRRGGFRTFFRALLVIFRTHYYSLGVFHISVSWWSFTRVWETASHLKSPGLSSVFWPISIIQ